MKPNTPKTDAPTSKLDDELNTILKKFYAEKRDHKRKDYNAYSQAIMDIKDLIASELTTALQAQKQAMLAAIGEDEYNLTSPMREHRNKLRAELREVITNLTPAGSE